MDQFLPLRFNKSIHQKLAYHRDLNWKSCSLRFSMQAAYFNVSEYSISICCLKWYTQKKDEQVSDIRDQVFVLFFKEDIKKRNSFQRLRGKTVMHDVIRKVRLSFAISLEILIIIKQAPLSLMQLFCFLLCLEKCEKLSCQMF